MPEQPHQPHKCECYRDREQDISNEEPLTSVHSTARIGNNSSEEGKTIMGLFRRPLPANEALVFVNANLVNARSTQDQKQAMKYCKDAKKELKRIKVLENLAHLNQIIGMYRDHGEILKKLGFNDKAMKSYTMADELKQYLPRVPVQLEALVITQPLSLSPTEDSPIRNSAPIPPVDLIADRLLSSLQITDALDRVSSPVPLGVPFLNQPMPIFGRGLELVLAHIFARNVHLQPYKGTLPKPDEDLIDTRQLVYCLTLLQDLPSPIDPLDELTRAWLQSTKTNQDEQERLKTMATDILIEFMNDTLKDEKTTAEIACIAPVLECNNFRRLLGTLVTSLRDSPLLHIHALEGLDRVIKYAKPGSMDPDDLIKILEHLKLCLQGTYRQSLDHVYRLTRTVSHILGAMVDGNIVDLNRVKLHTPLLLDIQKEMWKSKDPYMVFQAAYAFQALLRIPNEEELWKTVLRHAGTVVIGTGRLVSAGKSLNAGEFIDTVQGGLEGAGQLFKRIGDAYKDFSALKNSGQDFLEALKTSFNRKHDWYEELRDIDALLLNGKLTEFKTRVCNSHCHRELAFQWGVCQRLGNIAADPIWDADSQEGAAAFLGEIYRNDAVWGQEVKAKQCILDILMQLASTSGSAKQVADRLLQEFENDDDVGKRALCDASRRDGPSSHLLRVTLPQLSSSPLLERVQKTPAVESGLRKFGRDRMKDLGNTIYIAPEAKGHRRAADHDLFDLTLKVNEFLGGSKRVLLLWGDSGAGKSTFNKELEKELWKGYMDCEDRILRKKKKIPIFVSLPGIDKSEKDLIGRQLHDADFSEAQIKELKANREFVLICDGYDEYQQKRNLYNMNRLNRPGQWSAQMVISCRSEYLGHDYRDFFQPEDSQGRMGEALFLEAVIAPFSKEQIQAYIKKYIAEEAPQWSIEDYLQVLGQIPGLQELVSNPFLLKESLRVLPNMADLGGNLSHTKITRVMLYDRFLDHWVEQGKKRVIKRVLEGDDKKAFDILSDDDFVQNGILFVKKLAISIFKNQDGSPVVEYSPNREKGTWKAEFFGQDEGCKLLLEACPLRRDGNLHRFIHQSILEYGIARAIFEPRQRRGYGTRGQGTSDAAREQREHQSVDKDMSVATVPAPDIDSPLFWKNFVNKPVVLQFLAERVPEELILKQQLHDLIECSKMDKKWGIAAANAITILIRAGVRFNEADLKGIQVPGADLSGGQFDYAQLQGADLRGTNLCNTWLRQANLSNAQMSGVQFGEWPYLKEDDIVISCKYSPDGRTCAVNLASGTVRVYDTTTWVKIHTLHGHRGLHNSVTYSPSGRQIALGSGDGNVKVWDAQTGASDFTLSGHTRMITTVTYSPDSHQIVSGSDDKTARMWDAQTGAAGLTLRGHTHRIISVTYSPNGNQIASGSYDKTVRLWDAQTGASGPTLSGHSDPVTSVAYSPSGHQIASGSQDHTVRLWDAQTGALRHILNGHTSYVSSVTFSPDGSRIASGSCDDTVRLWDAQTGASGPILSGHTREIKDIVYSPNGHQIASGSDDGTVRLWDAQSGTAGFIFRGHNFRVMSVTYSPNGRQIASGGWDHTVRLWDAQTGAVGSISADHTHDIESLKFSPNGHQIASGSLDETVRLWDVQIGAPGHILEGHTNRVTSVTYSPNGFQIASGSYDKSIRLWDAQTGSLELILGGSTGYIEGATCPPCGHQKASENCNERVWLWDAQIGADESILSEHTSSISSLTYSPNGHQIASGSYDMTVRLWDAQSGAPRLTLRGHTELIRSVSYSPRGNQIASGSDDKTVRLWDAQTGAPGPILSGHTDGVNSVTYSPVGLQIASGSNDKTVRLWDAHTGAPGLILSGHKYRISSVTYSPSGHQIASGSDDYTVQLWDAQTGVSGPTLSGHSEPVTSVAYSPSGDQIASGSYDHTVRLWDAQTGALEHILSGSVGYIKSVTYSPSGHQIASGGYHNTVQLWDAQTGALGPTLSGHTSSIYSVRYSPNGLQIASGSDDDTVRLWDAQTGAPGLVLGGHTHRITSVTYSPDGRQIASGGLDMKIRLWDAQTGAPGPILSGHNGVVNSVTYSPNGHQIATGSDDRTVRLWDAQTGAPGLILTGCTLDVVISVTYSPNGLQIASGGLDMKIRLWDVQTGAPGLTMSGHTNVVNGVTYSPNGYKILSGGWDGMVRLWDVDSGQCLVVVENVSGVIKSVAWSAANNGIYFATASDNSVRMWKVVEAEDTFQMRLHWCSTHDRLSVSKTSIQDVQGLTSVNVQLLKQRGAVGNPILA